MNRRRLGKHGADVHWYIPNRKTPIAYSTCGYVPGMLETLTEDYGGTIQELRNRFGKEIIFNEDLVEILDAYIKYGYGDAPACEFFIYHY